MSFVEVDPQTDAGRMAVLAALRRDWRPAPATLPWTPAMQSVLFEVAIGIEYEARISTFENMELPL